jgi:hypothetical protein
MQQFRILAPQSYRMSVRAIIVVGVFSYALLHTQPALGDPMLQPNGNPTRYAAYVYPNGVNYSVLGSFNPATLVQLSTVQATLEGALAADSNQKAWTINPTNLSGNFNLVQYFAWAGASYFTNNPASVGPFSEDANMDNVLKDKYPASYPNIGGAFMGLNYDGNDTQHWIQLVGVKGAPAPVVAVSSPDGNWSYFIDGVVGVDITTNGPWYDNSGFANAQYFLDVPLSPPNTSLAMNFYTFPATTFSNNPLTITVGNVGVSWGWSEPLGPDDVAIPEPSSFALMSLAGAALIVSYWRRRRPLPCAVNPARLPPDQPPSSRKSVATSQ